MTVSREPHPVLIVEDDAGHRKIVVEACESLKLAPVAVSSFKEAIALLEANPRKLCLIVLDLKIPMDKEGPRVQNGLNLLARARELVPDRAALPIIVMTGEVATKFIKKAMQLGANDYANKPFEEDDEELDDRIMRWIQRGCEQRNKKTGCPNVAGKPAPAVRKPRGVPDVPAPIPGQPRITLVGSYDKKLVKILVDNVPCELQEVPFSALLHLAHGLKTNQQHVSIDRIQSGYNAISRLKKALREKGNVPPVVAKKLIVPSGLGYYRLNLPLDHVIFDDAMEEHFKKQLDQVRAAEATLSPQ
jgi:CheY-like chemotaxis protein